MSLNGRILSVFPSLPRILEEKIRNKNGLFGYDAFEVRAFSCFDYNSDGSIPRSRCCNAFRRLNSSSCHRTASRIGLRDTRSDCQYGADRLYGRIFCYRKLADKDGYLPFLRLSSILVFIGALVVYVSGSIDLLIPSLFVMGFGIGGRFCVGLRLC